MWAVVSSPYHPAILGLLETLEVEGRTLHLMTELMPCDVLGDAIFNVIMSEQGTATPHRTPRACDLSHASM